MLKGSMFVLGVAFVAALSSCNVEKKISQTTTKVDTAVLVEGFEESGSEQIESEFKGELDDIWKRLQMYQDNQLTQDEVLAQFSKYCKVKPVVIRDGNNVKLEIENGKLKYKLSKADSLIKVKMNQTTTTREVTRESVIQNVIWSIAGLVVGLAILVFALLVAYKKLI